MTPALRRWWPAVVGLLVVGAVFAVPLAGRGGGASAGSSGASPAAASTAAPTASPTPPSMEAVTGRSAPTAGRAALVAGPFTDRLRLQRLVIVHTPKPGVSGSFAQVFDNSALLDMEIQADFYDRDGLLLGSRKTVLRQPDVVRAARGGVGAQRYGGDIVFSVPAPAAFASRVSSALVSVPVLVNE